MIRRKIKGAYLRIDEEKNAIDFLEKSFFFIQKVEKDPLAWKWVIIALHGALYGFSICAARGSSNAMVTRTNKKGVVKLIGIWDALKLCQKKEYMERYTFSHPLRMTSEQHESIDWLVSVFRNNLLHYTPKLWSIELHGFPNMVMDVLDVIRFLAIDTRTMIHLKKIHRRKIKSLVFQSKRIFKNSDLYGEYLEIIKAENKSP